MKKYNSKQMAHSQKKVREAVLRLFGRFLLIAVMAFMVPTLVMAINNPADISTAIYLIHHERYREPCTAQRQGHSSQPNRVQAVVVID